MARQLQACLDSLNCMVGTDTYSARSLSVWMLVVRNPSTKVRWSRIWIYWPKHASRCIFADAV